MKEIDIGKVTHYYTRISVAVLSLTDELMIGDTIHILGRITDHIQRVGSMEIDHVQVQSVSPGSEVALLVDDYVRQGDSIFKIIDA